MPTVRPRHTTTESDEIAQLIDLALETMPARSTRSEAFRRLVEVGGATLTREKAKRTSRRREAVSRLQALTREFSTTDFREDQLSGWPE